MSTISPTKPDVGGGRGPAAVHPAHVTDVACGGRPLLGEPTHLVPEAGSDRPRFNRIDMPRFPPWITRHTEPAQPTEATP